jgi:hypothetical protein
VLALARSLEGGRVSEKFRTLHRRETPHSDFGSLPVFGIVEVEDDEAPDDTPDLTRMAPGMDR